MVALGGLGAPAQVSGQELDSQRDASRPGRCAAGSPRKKGRAVQRRAVAARVPFPVWARWCVASG